eukprot:symbB.v1.2.012603.t1/scaffold820.1/size171332/10
MSYNLSTWHWRRLGVYKKEDLRSLSLRTADSVDLQREHEWFRAAADLCEITRATLLLVRGCPRRGMFLSYFVVRGCIQVVEVKGTMGSKARLAPDPSVSVSDIMKAVTAVTQQWGISDMLKLLNSKHRMTWKSAPDAEWLGSINISTLCEKLFQVHSNGVLSSKKLQQALMKVQTTEGRLNFSKLHDADFLDRCDEQIRVACAQYREIKKDATKYVRCLKRASPEEKKNIDSVLSVSVFEDEEAEKPEDEIPRTCTEVEVEPAQVAAADSLLYYMTYFLLPEAALSNLQCIWSKIKFYYKELKVKHQYHYFNRLTMYVRKTGPPKLRGRGAEVLGLGKVLLQAHVPRPAQPEH